MPRSQRACCPTTRSRTRTPSRRRTSTRATSRHARTARGGHGRPFVRAASSEGAATIATTPTKEGVALAPAAAQEDALPRLADGIELVGEYKESGFKKPPF